MTTQTLWIVVAVVVAVLLIAALLGLVLRRQRRISLREAQQLEREPGPTPDGATIGVPWLEARYDFVLQAKAG